MFTGLNFKTQKPNGYQNLKEIAIVFTNFLPNEHILNSRKTSTKKFANNLEIDNYATSYINTDKKKMTRQRNRR